MKTIENDMKRKMLHIHFVLAGTRRIVFAAHKKRLLWQNATGGAFCIWLFQGLSSRAASVQ